MMNEVEVVLEAIPFIKKSEDLTNHCVFKAKSLSRFIRENPCAYVPLNERFYLMSRGYIPFVLRPKWSCRDDLPVTVIANTREDQLSTSKSKFHSVKKTVESERRKEGLPCCIIVIFLAFLITIMLLCLIIYGITHFPLETGIERSVTSWDMQKRRLSSKMPAIIYIYEYLEASKEKIVKFFRDVKRTQSTEKVRVPEEDITVPLSHYYRLPKNLRPVSYNLTIKIYLPFYVEYPDYKNLTTEGELNIDIFVHKPTNLIILNQKGLSLKKDKCEVYSNRGRLSIRGINVDHDLEIVKFELTETLRIRERVKLKIYYRGVVSTGLYGLYRTYYKDKYNNTKIAAATQMEPTSTRKMVPCFDEPEFKAIWDVTVIHPSATTAIANGFEAEVKELNRWKISTFQSSPIMSSYLLAIFVSEFTFDEMHTKRGVRVRVWSSPNTKQRRQHGLKSAVAFINMFEEYFGINDVSMKQGGENLLLKTGNVATRNIDLTVAHELAHQWFGNLVTTYFWNDLWLNEGFADFFEKAVYSKSSGANIKMNTYEFLADIDYALTTDSLVTSRPLSSIIEKTTELVEIFDAISYQKGGAIVAMVKAVVGDKNFRRGVNHYLKKFSFKNARREDLWQAFDEIIEGVSGPTGGRFSIVDFGNQWTKKMGFPLVSVKKWNTTSVKITQQRYIKNPFYPGQKKYYSPPHSYTWDVPIWYQTRKRKMQFTWLRKNEPLYMTVDPTEKPLVINGLGHGFFRQNYDEEGWQEITKLLKENHKVLSQSSRHVIIRDAFAAALIDRLNYETLFKMLHYFHKEKSYTQDLLDSQYNEAYGRYIKPMMTKNESGTADGNKPKFIIFRQREYTESHLNLEVAASLVETYCEFDWRNCTETFGSIFEKEVLNRCKEGEKASQCVRINSRFRRWTYCAGVKTLGKVAFEKVNNLVKLESNPSERENLLFGTACAANVRVLKKNLLDQLEAKDGEHGYRQLRIVEMFASVSLHRLSFEFLLDFCIEHWDLIYERLKPTPNLVQSVISYCFQKMRTETEIKQVKMFRKSNPSICAFNMLNRLIEEAEHRVMWIKRHSRELIKYFKSKTSLRQKNAG